MRTADEVALDAAVVMPLAMCLFVTHSVNSLDVPTSGTRSCGRTLLSWHVSIQDERSAAAATYMSWIRYDDVVLCTVARARMGQRHY